MRLSTFLLILTWFPALAGSTGCSTRLYSPGAPLPPVPLGRITASPDGRQVEISDINLTPNYASFGEGPLRALSAALKQHPKAEVFKVSWSMAGGSSWAIDQAWYDRTKSSLHREDVGGQGGLREECHVFYSDVTDVVLHNAATADYNNQYDGGFGSLEDYGCKARRWSRKTKY